MTDHGLRFADTAAAGDRDFVPAAPSWDFLRASAGVRTVVDAGVARGVAAERCLRLTGLSPHDLESPDLVVEAGQELQAMRNLVAAVGDEPGLGADVGRRFTLGTFGIWGYTLLTSPTWAEVVSTGVRFARLSYAFIRPVRTAAQNGVGIDLDPGDVPVDLVDFVVERDLAAAIMLFTGVGGGTAPLRFLTRFSGDRLAAIRDVAPSARVAGARAVDRIVVDSAATSRRPPQADAVTRHDAGRACEELLERRARRRGVAARVRALLLRDPAQRPTMSEVAARLNVDPRTLRRHLALEGVRFDALRDEVYSTLAVELLDTAGLTVDETRRRLGYADAASFTHAFRRWTGTTPGAWRRRAPEAGPPGGSPARRSVSDRSSG